MKDVYDIVKAWRKRRLHSPHQSQLSALATLVRVEGSSYRRPGARLLIFQDQETAGSLSAGCLEEEVVLRAREVIETGEPVVMSFDSRRRFGCTGQIDIFIERAPDTFFTNLADHLDQRRTCLAITTRDGSFVGETDRFSLKENREATGFPYSPLIQQIHPPVRFLIFGDGPDNAPLCSLGHSLGWEIVEIADPNALSLQTDNWTAAIVKSHNYGRDFTALQKLLPLNLPYVGLIGPRKRRDQLMNHLLDDSVTINAGFFAPAGLDLGAETPEEIALAVISEIQRVFNGGSGESLRERKTAIHDASRPATAHVSLPSEPVQT